MCGGGGAIPHFELTEYQNSELLLGLWFPPVEGEPSQVETGKPLWDTRHSFFRSQSCDGEAALLSPGA